MKTKLTREDFEAYQNQIIEGNKQARKRELLLTWADSIMLPALKKKIESMPKSKKK